MPPSEFNLASRIIHLYAWSHLQTQEEELRPVCLTKSSVLLSEIFLVVFKFLQIFTTDIIYNEVKDFFNKKYIIFRDVK